jgi:cation:H+ antiporter
MLVGLTIVAFGTSAPEFAVSIKSMLAGSGEIVLGNVIGSNILNILLILGVSSLFHTLTVKNNTVKKEIPITLLLSTALIVLMTDKFFDGYENMITRGDGLVILLFFCVFIYYLISMARNKTQEVDEDKETILPLSKSIIYTVIGIVAIVLGSNFVVDSAKFIASSLGVSERIIGLTIIALGTSLPELVTSIIATRKGEYDIAIGNVVGSNIFNIGVVLGLPIAIFGNVSIGTFNILDLGFLFLSSLALFIFAGNDYKITKREGLFMIFMFVIYYGLIII